MSKIAYYVRKYGILGLVPLTVRRVTRALVHADGSEIDRKYGVDTDKIVFLDHLEIPSSNVRFGSHYEATNEGTFQKICEKLPSNTADYTFVDYGCGKGRSLVLAALHGFRRIVGIDFSPELCAAAEGNVDRFKRLTGNRAEISVRCADAMEVEPPHEQCVLCMYNPFLGPVVQAVHRRIDLSPLKYPRDLFVAYANPQWRRETFDRCEYLRVHASSMWTPDWYVIYRSCPDFWQQHTVPATTQVRPRSGAEFPS